MFVLGSTRLQMALMTDCKQVYNEFINTGFLLFYNYSRAMTFVQKLTETKSVA